MERSRSDVDLTGTDGTLSLPHPPSRGEPMPTIVEIGPDRLAELRDLWLALHRHHAEIGSRPLVADEEVSWQRRRALYERWLKAGEAFALVAERQGEPVGYAVVHLHDGPDDTYPVGARWAEIYSLSVAPQ